LFAESLVVSCPNKEYQDRGMECTKIDLFLVISYFTRLDKKFIWHCIFAVGRSAPANRRLRLVEIYKHILREKFSVYLNLKSGIFVP
jgi:hypothetical protein